MVVTGGSVEVGCSDSVTAVVAGGAVVGNTVVVVVVVVDTRGPDS